MRQYRIAAIPGDGIGSEVDRRRRRGARRLAPGGMAALRSLSSISTGARERYKKHRRLHAGERSRPHQATTTRSLFGSAGAPDVPDHITLWGLRLAICQPFDQYANVRPTRILPGITSPLRHVIGPELDWVIVRENSEGEYAGVGGRVHRGLPEEVGDRRVDVHARRRRAHHALCLRAWRARGRASCSRSSPNRTRSATAW